MLVKATGGIISRQLSLGFGGYMDYKVLVADDEKEIRNLLRLYLENESFKVIEATDGEETLRLVREKKPDICLLDIMMPGIDGLHAMQEIRRESNIPIMIISARTYPRTQSRR